MRTFDSLQNLATQNRLDQINELKESFKLYDAPFTIQKLDGEELVIESITTKVYAVRDDTLDGLF